MQAPFNVNYMHTACPPQIVNRNGQNQISAWLRELGIVFPKNEFDWTWKSQQTINNIKLVGNLTRRISKFCVSQNKEISAMHLAHIGNIAKHHMPQRSQYSFRFTQNFKWDPGQYGDGGSCFWTCHSGAKHIIKQNYGYAVLFYAAQVTLPEALNHRNGLGRAWLLPYIAQNTAVGWILFNGYGIQTEQIALVLAQYFGLSQRSIQLRNNSSENDGVMYFNNGTGFVLASPTVVKAAENTHDFQFKTQHYRKVHCFCCAHNDYALNGVQVPPDTWVCNNCADENVLECDRCSSPTTRRWGTIYRNGIEVFYCQMCRTNHCKVCQACNRIYDSKTACVCASSLATNINTVFN